MTWFCRYLARTFPVASQHLRLRPYCREAHRYLRCSCPRDIEYPGHVVGELIEKFLQYDGLRDVHSFEKAVTIRDANNEIVEDDETPRFTPGRDIVDEIATGSGDDDSNRQDEGDDEDEDIEQDEDKENKDEEEDKTFGSGGLARWRWHETNEYHLPGAYRRLMIRPGQWTHRQVEYTGYTQLLRPLEEIDKCALLAHNDRKDQCVRMPPCLQATSNMKRFGRAGAGLGWFGQTIAAARSVNAAVLWAMAYAMLMSNHASVNEARCCTLMGHLLAMLKPLMAALAAERYLKIVTRPRLAPYRRLLFLPYRTNCK